MTHFISVDSNIGRIGRLCWVNSDLRQSHRSFMIAQGEIGDRSPWLYALGWWGSVYWSSPHPARSGEAW